MKTGAWTATSNPALPLTMAATYCAATRILKWTHLPCFGHSLDLAVGNSMKDESRVNRAFGVCRNEVSAFSQRKRELESTQLELGLPTHSLVTDCPTQWGSKKRMVLRVLEQQQAIRQVLSGDCKAEHLIPTWQDVDVLESVQAAVGPLADFTDMLSGEQLVTVSSINPI